MSDYEWQKQYEQMRFDLDREIMWRTLANNPAKLENPYMVTSREIALLGEAYKCKILGKPYIPRSFLPDGADAIFLSSQGHLNGPLNRSTRGIFEYEITPLGIEVWANKQGSTD